MEDLTRRLRRVYRKATEELEESLAEFEAKHSLRDAKMRQKLADGKITKQYYDRWKRGQVFQGKQWRAKLDSAARTLEHADEEAAKIMNRQRIGTFTEAANEELRTASIITGVDFNVYDQRTVDRLLREEPNLLPPRRVKRADDVAWYHQLISNAVTRSIIEGDSIEGLAHKIAMETGEKSWNAAKRNARTAMTAAQNAGRLESMHDVQARGIKVKKKWLAAHDSRVRDTHRELDGQEKEVDEPFEVGGMEIMYPGDPAAHPSLVYNCRCTLQYVYPEYSAGRRIDDIEVVPTSDIRSIEQADKQIRKIERRLDSWNDKRFRSFAESATAYTEVESELKSLYEARAAMAYPDDDVMVGIPHIAKRHTAEQDILASNPKFRNNGGTAFETNCQRTAPTYEMRRRGYDVVARPRPITGEDLIAGEWKHIFEGAEWIRCAKGSGYNEMVQHLKGWGKGARAEIYVKWKTEPGKRPSAHTFIAENVGGKIVFRDPQSGEAVKAPFQARVEEGTAQICRIDNLKPSGLILECCEGANDDNS